MVAQHRICHHGVAARRGRTGNPFAVSDPAAQEFRSVAHLSLHNELVLLRVHYLDPRQVAAESGPDFPTNTGKKLARVED